MLQLPYCHLLFTTCKLLKCRLQSKAKQFHFSSHTHVLFSEYALLKHLQLHLLIVTFQEESEELACSSAIEKKKGVIFLYRQQMKSAQDISVDLSI